MNMLKKLTYLIILALAITACDDVLDGLEPATSVSGETVLSTEDGVNALRASLYSKQRASFSYTTQYFVGPSAFADETRNRNGSERFNDLNQAVGTSGNVGLGNWGATYNIVQDANLLIGAVEEGVLDDATLAQYRGEAFAIRAMVMHNAVRTYGNDPTSPFFSNGDLGVIIRTEPTLDVSDADARPRATVLEVYEQILSDLAQAKTLLAGQNDDNTLVTEAFVDGLTARVNLYAGNYSAAATAAQAAIANAPALVDTEDDVAEMWVEGQGGGNHPEALYKLVVDPDTEPIAGDNTNDGLAAYTSSQWVAQVPAQNLMDLFEEDDFRIGSYVLDDDGNVQGALDEGDNPYGVYSGGWFQRCFNSQTDFAVNGCQVVNSDSVSTAKWEGGNGNLSDDIPYMRTAELYLILAEAEAKGGDLPAGVQALNTLRAARNASTYSTGDFANLTEFEDEILDERMRELFAEGHRFYDLKRLGRDIPNAVNPDGDILPIGNQGIKMRGDSYRVLARIPDGVISTSIVDGAEPLVIQNPGYSD
jgi:hypothetical protein